MNPEVSIIIPHHNIPSLLRRMLNTVPDRKEIQTIVIDDHSTEHLDEYEKLKDDFPYITFVDNDGETKGTGPSRNIGLELAVGKWVVFADSDDMLTDTFYESVSGYFNSDADIVYFPPLSYTPGSEKQMDLTVYCSKLVFDHKTKNTEKTELLLRYMFTVVWSRLIRRDVVKRHDITHCESLMYDDALFSVQLAYYARKIAVADGSIYKYCMRDAVIEQVDTREHYKTAQAAMSLAGQCIKRYVFLRDRLPRKTFLLLPLHGIIILANLITMGYSMKTVISAARELKKNNVRLFHKGFLYPTYLVPVMLRWLSRRRLLKRVGIRIKGQDRQYAVR